MSTSVLKKFGVFKSMAVILMVGVVAIAAVGSSLVEQLSSGEYLIVQSPIKGTMTVYLTPGLKWQGFGTVWHYSIEDIMYFSKHPDEGGAVDQSVLVRFNDGATANITANARFRLPANEDDLLKIHQRFRSYEGLKRDGMRQLMSESIILTAALMSAEESYTTKRSRFPEMAWDQVMLGLYLTYEDSTIATDELTGERSRRSVVRIKTDDNGEPMRKINWVNELRIIVPSFVCQDIDYEITVDEQITKKRKALMETVAAKAQAEKAIQDRRTAEEEGKKDVAVAKYQAEVVKQKAVTNAQQEKEVAELAAEKLVQVEKFAKEQALVAAVKQLEVAEFDAKAAEQEKIASIKRGQGQAEARRLVMAADGALTLKLEAYKAVNKYYAEAIASTGKPWVPQIVFGGSNNNHASGANDLIQMLTAQTARSLALDLTPRSSPAAETVTADEKK